MKNVTPAACDILTTWKYIINIQLQELDSTTLNNLKHILGPVSSALKIM